MGKTTYVVTHRSVESSQDIIFTSQDLESLVTDMKKNIRKNIWICGGANIIRQLVSSDLIDEYYISVMPTILGSGIRLFDNIADEIKLKLVQTQAYNGIVDLVYVHR